MANMSGEIRLLEEYEKELDNLFDEVSTDAKANAKLQKEIDRKMPIYLKQIQIVKQGFPESEAGRFHESYYHVFRARRTAFSSVMARRIAQGSSFGVTGLAAAGIANAQEKANFSKAIGIFDEALAACDTAYARFYKAGFLEVLGKKEEAKAEYRYLIQNFPDSDEIYISARKALDVLENPPKKGPCFVATACYGDYDHPDVWTLRIWRDRRLLTCRAGRIFVNQYYRFGPGLAKVVERSPRMTAFIRRRLEAFVRRLRR